MKKILENTDEKTLFELFKKYTDKLVVNTYDRGIFAVEDEFDPEDFDAMGVFGVGEIRQVVEQLKKESKNWVYPLT